MDPASSPLSINVHGNSSQTSGQRQPSNHKESLSNTLIGNPIVDVERQSERKRIFDKVHDGKCLGRFIPMCVDHIGYDSGRPELNTEIDETQTDNYRNRPGILCIGCLTPSEKADRREHEIRNQDWKTEFRF